MYKKLLIAVDLAHPGQMEKALATAADLARLYGIPICIVSVGTAAPGEVAHNPAEFAARLDEFAAAQRDRFGLDDISASSYTSHDPSVDMDPTLLRAIEESGADLVVMASHKPGLPEHLFASNAGYVAMHSKSTVVVVR